MLLKEKIEKFKNKEIIDISSVLMDKNGDFIYSINDNLDELKELFFIANKEEKYYLFKNIFWYNPETKKTSNLENLKEVIFLFIENSSFEEIKKELLFIKKDMIVNILPLLKVEDFKKNINWLLKEISILDINSEEFRKIYFNEYEKNKNSDNNIISSTYFSISENEKYVDGKMLNNISSTIKLINTNSEGFFRQTKTICPDSYHEEIMILFNLNIGEKNLVSDEEIKEYTKFIIKNIRKENIDLEDVIFPEEINYILGHINPVVFGGVIEEFVNSKNNIAINKLVERCIEFENINKELNEEKYIKNKNYLFEQKALIEKRELFENVKEYKNKSEVKRRL